MNDVKYVSQGRNGYGAIDLYRDGKCMRTVMAGIKPAKLADEIAAHLNAAYWDGAMTAAADVLDSLKLAVDNVPVSHAPIGHGLAVTVEDYVINHYGEN